MNPYWGDSFFSFFATLSLRLWHFLSGHLSLAQCVSDEKQILVMGAVALACGVLGPFLVLKRMAMLANATSHTMLIGIAFAYLFSASLSLPFLLIGALAAALLTAFFSEGLHRFFGLTEDASIGLVFTGLFALGIVAVTLFTRDVHLGVEAVVGNADMLLWSDVKTTGLLALANAAIIGLLFHRLQLAAFDQNLARSLHWLLLLLTAATCIGAFRAVGVILVLAFLVGPYLTARLFCHRLSHLLFWTPAVGVLATLVGVALSRHFLTAFDLPLSTGGIVTVVIGLFYAAGHVVRPFLRDKRFLNRGL